MLLETGMKNKTFNKSLKAGLVLVAFCGGAVGNALAQEISSDIFSSPFNSCFADGYNLSLVTQDQAYATAECFTSLLEKEGAETAYLGASKHTIMEYSVSWYSAAAAKGHELAQANLDTNMTALNLLEQEMYFGVKTQDQQLLASEKVFQTLDTDNNGVLSLAEASSSPTLKEVFSKSDFDNDGMLNFGEYTILSGEATAAGN